jgi:hypothetical protein
MKYLIYCLPRTRSSLLQDVISQKYNLTNLEEPYIEVEKKAKKNLIFHNNKLVWENYQKNVLEVTKNLETQDNIVVKIFSDITFNHLKYRKLVLNDSFSIDNDDIVNPEKVCSMQSYDKIFLLYRQSITDLFCSYRYGKNFQKLQYEDTQLDKSLVNFRSTKKINLVYDDVSLASDVLQYLYFQHQARHLLKVHPNITMLEYDEIPMYVNKNFEGVTSKFLETNFDYKELVKNYNVIDSKINFYYNKFLKLFSE